MDRDGTMRMYVPVNLHGQPAASTKASQDVSIQGRRNACSAHRRILALRMSEAGAGGRRSTRGGREPATKRDVRSGRDGGRRWGEVRLHDTRSTYDHRTSRVRVSGGQGDVNRRASCRGTRRQRQRRARRCATASGRSPAWRPCVRAIYRGVRRVNEGSGALSWTFAAVLRSSRTTTSWR